VAVDEEKTSWGSIGSRTETAKQDRAVPADNERKRAGPKTRLDPGANRADHRHERLERDQMGHRIPLGAGPSKLNIATVKDIKVRLAQRLDDTCATERSRCEVGPLDRHGPASSRVGEAAPRSVDGAHARAKGTSPPVDRRMEDHMATVTTRSRASSGSASNGRSTTNGARPSRRRVSPQPRLGQTAPELQRFNTLLQLPIALSTKARSESCRLLNEILADSTVLYALYKKAHWNATGPTFFQLHLLFDKHAEEQLELIDQIAERVQMLGGVSLGDPRHAAELTTIPRPPDGTEEVPVVLSRLLDAHETIVEKVRAGLDATEKSKDMGTNDLLMGDVLRRHEMQVWFISEHIVEAPLVEA
jgi:starvation-inducible DNA-binding protein